MTRRGDALTSLDAEQAAASCYLRASLAAAKAVREVGSEGQAVLLSATYWEIRDAVSAHLIHAEREAFASVFAKARAEVPA